MQMFWGEICETWGSKGRQPEQNFIHEYARRELKTTAPWNLDTVAKKPTNMNGGETERAQCQYVTR